MGERCGTFIAAHLTDESQYHLRQWLRRNGIREPVRGDDFHVTVLLRDDKIIPFEAIRFQPPLLINPTTFHLDLLGPPGEKTTLVLRFEEPELEHLHYSLRRKYHVRWDFPDYRPHITLRDADYTAVPKMSRPDFDLHLESIRSEPNDPQYESKIDESATAWDSPRVRTIAAKFNMPVSAVKQALRQGLEVEMRRQIGPGVAKSVVLNHLWDRPDFYRVQGESSRAVFNDPRNLRLVDRPKLIKEAQEDIDTVPDVYIYWYDRRRNRLYGEERRIHHTGMILNNPRWFGLTEDAIKQLFGFTGSYAELLDHLQSIDKRTHAIELLRTVFAKGYVRITVHYQTVAIESPTRSAARAALRKLIDLRYFPQRVYLDLPERRIHLKFADAVTEFVDTGRLIETHLDEVTGRLRITPTMIANAKRNKAQMLVEMSPEDFLRLTVPEGRTTQDFTDRAQPLHRYNWWAKVGNDRDFRSRVNAGKSADQDDYAWGIRVHPFLRIEIRKDESGLYGIVTGHEGRHRAAALLRKHGTKMPVALQLRPSESTIDRVERPNRFDDPRYYMDQRHLPQIVHAQFTNAVVRTSEWTIIHRGWRRMGQSK